MKELRAGKGRTCGFTYRPLYYISHAFGNSDSNIVLFTGAVGHDINRLQVRLQDGWKNIPLTEGYFLYRLTKTERPLNFKVTHDNGRIETLPGSRRY